MSVSTLLHGLDVALVDRTTDVARSAEGLAHDAFWCAGQGLFAISAALVHEDAYEAVAAAVAERAAGLRVGPGIDYGTDVGPLIHAAAADAFGSQGGKLLAELGPTYAAPTVVTDVEPSAIRDVRGPFLALAPVADVEAGQAAARALGARSVAVTTA